MESSVPSKTGSPSSEVPVVETSPLSLDAASQNGSGDDALEESMSEASRSELWAAEELHALRAVLQVQDKQNKLTIKTLRELTRSHETIIVSLRKEAAQAEAALVMVSNAHVKSIGEHAKREAVLISNVEEEKVRTSAQRDSHLRELEATLDLISCMRKEATSQAEDHQAELNRQQEFWPKNERLLEAPPAVCCSSSFSLQRRFSFSWRCALLHLRDFKERCRR
jgi:hypothetical protein